MLEWQSVSANLCLKQEVSFPTFPSSDRHQRKVGDRESRSENSLFIFGHKNVQKALKSFLDGIGKFSQRLILQEKIIVLKPKEGVKKIQPSKKSLILSRAEKFSLSKTFCSVSVSKQSWNSLDQKNRNRNTLMGATSTVWVKSWAETGIQEKFFGQERWRKTVFVFSSFSSVSSWDTTWPEQIPASGTSATQFWRNWCARHTFLDSWQSVCWGHWKRTFSGRTPSSVWSQRRAFASRQTFANPTPHPATNQEGRQQQQKRQLTQQHRRHRTLPQRYEESSFARFPTRARLKLEIDCDVS